MTTVREKVKRCMACGHPIIPGGIEDTLYPVGDKEICSWCLYWLKRRGFARIGRAGYYRDMILLFDGSVISKKEFDERQLSQN